MFECTAVTECTVCTLPYSSDWVYSVHLVIQQWLSVQRASCHTRSDWVYSVHLVIQQWLSVQHVSCHTRSDWVYSMYLVIQQWLSVHCVLCHTGMTECTLRILSSSSRSCRTVCCNSGCFIKSGKCEARCAWSWNKFAASWPSCACRCIDTEETFITRQTCQSHTHAPILCRVRRKTTTESVN